MLERVGQPVHNLVESEQLIPVDAVMRRPLVELHKEAFKVAFRHPQRHQTQSIQGGRQVVPRLENREQEVNNFPLERENFAGFRLFQTIVEDVEGLKEKMPI